MYNSIRDSLVTWHKDKDSRTKLQQSYAVVAAISIVLAGLVSLLNTNYGQLVLQFGLMLIALVLVNALAWALLQTFLLQKLPKNTSRSRK